MVARARLQWVLPQGWYVKESITMLSPDGQANVIFSSEPLAAEIDLERYAGIQGELLEREFPGFERRDADISVTLDGVGPAIRRTFSWTPPDGSPVTQTQLYAVADGRGYTATATTPTANVARLGGLLLSVLESLSVGPPPEGGAA
jgi:hypothetical protein